MAKKKPIKGTHASGSRIDEVKRESVRQTYALTGNKSETARREGVSLRSVYNILGERSPLEMEEQRIDTLSKVASRVHTQADKVMDALEKDTKGLDSATFMQKTTGFAILVDKSLALDKHLAERNAQMQARLEGGEDRFLPKDVQGLADLLSNRIQSVDILMARIRTRDPDNEVAQKAKDLMSRAQKMAEDDDAMPAEESKVVVVDDLDGRGTD